MTTAGPFVVEPFVVPFRRALPSHHPAGCENAAVTAGSRQRWVAGAAWVLAGLLVAPVVWHQLRRDPAARLVDLEVYRGGASALLHGRPLYAFATPPPQALPFTYPPLAALLAVPLAVLPHGVVLVGWCLVVAVALVVVLRRVTPMLLAAVGERLGPDARAAALPLLVAGAAWLLPVRAQWVFGQVDLVLLALVLVDLVPSGRSPAGGGRPASGGRPAGGVRRWLPVGVLVGLAAAVKLTPALLVPYLLLAGRRRAAAVAAGTAVGLTLLAAAVAPGTSAAYWGGALLDTGRLGANAGVSNQSLRGMALRSGLPGWAQLLLVVAVGVPLLVVGLRRAVRLSHAGDELAAVTVVGMLSVALSPVSWVHHLVWVLPAVAVLAGRLDDRRRLLAAVALAGVFALTLPFTARTLVRHDVPPVFLWRVGEDVLGLVAVAVALLLPARRNPAAASLVADRMTPTMSRPPVEVSA